MFPKKVILFLLFLFISLRAFSTVFTVTSNADSGTGTLRDALTQAAAADSSVTNYIYFNIPDTSQAGRTIFLQSQLPDVCSNLTIDGGTQTGSYFGVSTSKIALFYQTPPTQALSGLRITNKHDVSIFGLYLKFLTNVNNVSTFYFWKGIELANDINIQIGAAGKGNVITNFFSPLSTNFSYGTNCQNITLKANLFSVDVDGETPSTNMDAGVFLQYVSGQVVIGGQPNEGNQFAAQLEFAQDNSDPSVPVVNILISNNKIRVDFKVQHVLPVSYTGLFYGINLQCSNPGCRNTANIVDNIIACPNGTGINVANNSEQVTILRNYIGTDKTLQIPFSTTYGIVLTSATPVQIGSINAADANYIANCGPISVDVLSTATYNKNSIFCVTELYIHSGGGQVFPYPFVSITQITATSVTGTATPNSNIELFYSDKCATCAPQTYFASTVADGNGNWVYSGPINGTVIASATLGLNTSEFTRAFIDSSAVKIVNACGDGTGSITGLVANNAVTVKWYDQSGKVVGQSSNLLNVKLGSYKMVIQNGSCADSTSYYQIQNEFQVDTSAIKKTASTCNNPNGSITGINIINNDQGAPYLIWQDKNGAPLGYALTLSGVPAGSYYLQVKSADSTCSQVFGPFTLNNVSGPNIDQSKAAIQSTNCDQSTGSITGLIVTGTGTLSYIWWNSQLQTVGTSQDLLNQPAGTYKLEVTDQSQCGPVYTTDLIIPSTNGITLNDASVQITPASCSNNNGSITGIVATNATAFQWVNAGNVVVGTMLNLSNVGPGDYTLTASNGSGCSVTSKTYTVAQLPPTVFPAYTTYIYQSCTGKANGGVNVLVDSLVKLETWENQLGQIINTGIGISNVPAGIYLLYLTDKNGCQVLYGTYEVPDIPQLQIDAGSAVVTNDQCSQNNGSITGIQVSGGRPPYVYQWLDVNNKPISSSADLSGLAAGTYTFTVNDATTCGIVSTIFTIINQDIMLSPPLVSDLEVCSPGEASLRIKDTQNGYGYRLYASDTSAIPIDEQSTGNFNINVKNNGTLYVSEFLGTCESARAAVRVSVGLSSVNISNTFTPNGDGINDYWVINGIAGYPAAEVQVFTRWGRRVFDSKGYATPFDGNYNGERLPDGVYYYIINLNDTCNLISGSLTIIR